MGCITSKRSKTSSSSSMTKDDDGKNFEGKSALLIIDVQNDFVSGSLAVPGATEIVPLINELRNQCEFDFVAHSQDSHPADHCSFVDNHEGAAVYSHRQIPTPDDSDDTMEQVMWPRHCVKGSEGEAFHSDLLVGEEDFIQKKGEDSKVDSYSAFFDNFHGRSTGLEDVLHQNGIAVVFVCGLAFDFCVGSSALDAKKLGFHTYVVDDLSRAVAGDSAEEMRDRLKKGGVEIISSEEVAKHVQASVKMTRRESTTNLDNARQGINHGRLASGFRMTVKN